jgi:multidrug efflux pump subunit AcrA (membrane-fusion protein)
MITKGGAGYTAQFSRIAPRVLLIALLALASAYTLELRLFENEIDRRMEMQSATAIGDIDEQIAAHEADTKSLREQLQSATADVNEKLHSYVNEVDGSGGTMQPGFGGVATIKRRIYEQAENELKHQQTQVEAQIRANSVRVAELQSRKDQLLRDRSNHSRNLIARAEALAALRRENSAVRRIQYLFFGFFIFIGIMPILLKLLAPAGLYEYAADHEHDHLAIQQMRQLDERTERTAEMVERAFAAALDESILNPADRGAVRNGSR